MPQYFFSREFRNTLIALFIAMVVVFGVVTSFNFTTLLVVLILTYLIIIFMNSSYGVNYEASLPGTTYPPPPHLGLDGVSVENIF